MWAVSIAVDDSTRVSGLLQVPPAGRVCYVLAHGAGAGMTHAFMAAVADGLAERNVATLRYQFPYMEQGRKRPDTPQIAQATVRAAIAGASRLLPELALVAGGKSFGGRPDTQRFSRRCSRRTAPQIATFRFRSFLAPSAITPTVNATWFSADPLCS